MSSSANAAAIAAAYSCHFFSWSAHVGPRAVVGRRLVPVDPDAGTPGPHDEMPAYTPHVVFGMVAG
ncbi:hypothetical protein B0T13DRAFT_392523 [Neurospora crassa]|nr:hypothetical protein B0T13DRAFT_392523 [Neurospora crassa]